MCVGKIHVAKISCGVGMPEGVKSPYIIYSHAKEKDTESDDDELRVL